MSEKRAQQELLGAEWSARLVIVFLGLPSLGFAIVSGMFNASYAARLGHSEHEQTTWVAASILITAFVTGLPLAIEILRPRVPHLAALARGLWLASMGFSFIAALGYAAATRGEATAEATSAINNKARLERAIDRSEAELAALPRHRPMRAVQADLRAAEVRVGVNCERARSRQAREVCAPVLTLKAELAAAEDASRIESRLTEQRQTLSSGRVVATSANPQADVLSWLAGGLLGAETWERLLTVFIAGLIEVSAALGLAITARSVVELLRTPDTQEVAEVAPVVAPEAAPVKVEPELAFTMWFGACVSPSKGARISPRDAYAHYEAWASLNSVAGVLPFVTFGRRMSEAVEAIGGKLGKSNNRYYGDVALAQLGSNGVPVGEAAE